MLVKEPKIRDNTIKDPRNLDVIFDCVHLSDHNCH